MSVVYCTCNTAEARKEHVTRNQTVGCGISCGRLYRLERTSRVLHEPRWPASLHHGENRFRPVTLLTGRNAE
jgi:hypothetical protein